MYKITKSVTISEDLHEDLFITSGAVVVLASDYTGNIHLTAASKLVIGHVLTGSVVATGNSVIENHGVIQQGFFVMRDSAATSGYRSYGSAFASSEVPDSVMKEHSALEDGELDPPAYPFL